MSKSLLLVCQSCHGSDSRSPEQPADGEILCDRIQALYDQWPWSSELEVRGVDCLWTCDHPCSIALMGDNKAVYALAKILIEDDKHSDIAAAVLKLSERYLDSKQGSIPWKQFPEVLRTEFIARIPPSNLSDLDEVSQ